MRERLGISHHSLTVQMVLSFVALVAFTAVLAGLPAILLIRNQSERQAWAQVNQGRLTTEALYTIWEGKVRDLADLTAQRPTLHRLLQEGNETAFHDYLQTLQENTELDLMLICRAGQPVVQVGATLPAQSCLIPDAPGFHVMPGTPAEQLWLLAARSIGEEAAVSGKVIVGVALNEAFLAQLQAQTGLSHTLLREGQPLAGSLAAVWPIARSRPAAPPFAGLVNPRTVEANGRPYYTTQLLLNDSGLVDEVALDVTMMASTQRRLALNLAGSIFLVALLGSALGVFLARRIGRPLARLAAATAHLSSGDLDTPVSVTAPVREVALVAQALESARIDLQATLTELRQAQAWTERLLDAIVEGIVTLDQNGRITFFSPGAERLTGWKQEEVLHRACDDLFRPLERDEPFSQLIPPPNRQRKIALELAGGRRATVAITVAHLWPPDVDQVEVALVFRDVSETELVHRLLGQFLANITHEFRTPLSALAASTELLLDQAPELRPDELQELLNPLHLGIVALQTFVDNLLESASLEAGRFRIHPHPADLGEIIGEATRIMQPLREKYGQQFTIELPTTIPVVHVDPRRIVQVLVNLLSNAIKYSPDETEIVLGAAVHDGWVTVTVADRGPGVPPGYRPVLFRRLIPEGSEATKSQYGAGLGLSVVKAIVEAHGGQAGVRDRTGGGSVFWFTIPVAENHESINRR